MTRLVSTSGYAEEADALAVQYESVAPAPFFAPVLALLPNPPSRVLDVGSGTGRDGAWLAGLGHDVTLVEPTAALRAHGERLHADVPLTWIDDALPDLARLPYADEAFDLVLCMAVFMHLDSGERDIALRRLIGLMRTGGLLVMSLRYGPVPEGRRMFAVEPAEVVSTARLHGAELVHHDTQDDDLGRAEVTWRVLALRKV